MPFDWKRLSPHRPLAQGDPLHVQRPDGGGDALAAWIEAGEEAIAVVGPVGVGKSTELARAAARLAARFVVVLIPLDRLLDMRRVTEAGAFAAVWKSLTKVADPGVGLAKDAKMVDAVFQNAIRGQDPGGDLGRSARDGTLAALRGVAQRSPQGATVLLVDGLEKCEPEAARQVVRALLDLREDTRIVVVAPFALAIGQGAYEIVSSVNRILPLRAISVRPDQGDRAVQGRAFLAEIVRARLSLPSLPGELLPVLDRAAEASGGVIRSFLQLVRSAASYAALSERETLQREDLDAAMRDHAESLTRLLVAGDIQALRDADGTTGVEVPEERRLRLLMHGLLLEYAADSGVIVHPAPLLDPTLGRGGPA